jgi:hypothetical protein
LLAGTSSYSCALDVQKLTGTNVVCNLYPSATGVNMALSVNVGGWVVTSVDTINYPTTFPVIYSVSGCTPQPVNRTVDCTTSGGVDITLIGRNFLGQVGAPS